MYLSSFSHISDTENNNDFTVATGGKGKKGKKGKKMQKVDSSILGFTVHAENDLNRGGIETEGL